MGRPGIMLYFDILDPVKMLSDEDKGRLLVAILEYGRDGIVPELDGALGIVWSFIRPKIDKDEERYDESRLQREYAAFCKKRKRIWMPKILFDDWITMTEDERQRAVDPVASRNPTTTNSYQPSDTSISHHPSTYNHHIQSQQSAAYYNPHLPTDTPHLLGGEKQAAAAATDSDYLKVMEGKLGKGVVFLTDDQVEDLLDIMGVDAFDKYVDKLSRYIIQNDANVGDHYGTILKWWRQDSGLMPR